MTLRSQPDILRRARSDPAFKALLGAAFLVANEGGETVSEIAILTGISKATIRKFAQESARLRRRDPDVHLVYCSLIAGGCDHTRLFAETDFAVCLYCLEVNKPNHPALRIYPDEMPKPEPSKVYRPGELKGGTG